MFVSALVLVTIYWIDCLFFYVALESLAGRGFYRATPLVGLTIIVKITSVLMVISRVSVFALALTLPMEKILTVCNGRESNIKQYKCTSSCNTYRTIKKGFSKDTLEKNKYVTILPTTKLCITFWLCTTLVPHISVQGNGKDTGQSNCL